MGEVKSFTRAEVAQRHGRSGEPVWTIIRDSVYDVTRYINEHPGGVDALQDAAGMDATRNFDDVGHSSDAKSIMTKYKIGEVVEEEKVYDANGKKKKKTQVVNSKSDQQTSRSCFNIITCGLVG